MAGEVDTLGGLAYVAGGRVGSDIAGGDGDGEGDDDDEAKGCWGGGKRRTVLTVVSTNILWYDTVQSKWFPQ